MDGGISFEYSKFGKIKRVGLMRNTLIEISTLIVISISITLISCNSHEKLDNELYPLQKLILIPEITDMERVEFNREVESEFTSIKEEYGKEISGYKTKNKLFLEKVITPLLIPHLDSLANKSHTQIINTLTLFGYEIYQKYFGQNFYRWGGDILDLDDPQDRSVRYKCAFGLDCSGFSAMPYELAVYFKLLSPEQALFSSKGYLKYCLLNGKHDIGGRDGRSNNFRLDTSELAELGREVFKLGKNQVPTEGQIRLLQPGDIVGRSGHFGIIAGLNGEPYYFESGGWVVPKNNGIPVKAIEALKIFAFTGPITVRRCLE
jgi:hypothetical protein